MTGALAACALIRAKHGAAAIPELSMLVAGPPGAQTSRWADACALGMGPGFAGTPQIQTLTAGGLDGVTGANRLDALVEPDGTTAAILPGAALLAWLTGDSRAHFDPLRWVPLMGGSCSSAMVVRLPQGSPASLAALKLMAPLRVAVNQLASPDLAMLLALARMEITVTPVFGLHDMAAKTQAFAAGQVDAVFVCNEGAPADVSALVASGGTTLFSLGGLAVDGTTAPDMQFPGLPDVLAFNGSDRPFLDRVYQAAAMAARLDFLIVLPRLTAPSAVAQWRQAANVAMLSPALAAAGNASAVVLQPASAMAAALNALDLGSADQTGLEAYLAKSFGWQPG